MKYKQLLNKNPHFVDWDFEIGGEPYQVVGYDGPNNKDYACFPINGYCARKQDFYIPENEDIEVVNCYGVRGEAPKWEIKQSKTARIKDKWGESSVRFSCLTTIYRNDLRFFEFPGEDEYAYHKAKSFLVEVFEGPVNLFSRFWQNKLEGREIAYCGQPAFIKAVSRSPFFMWVVPKNGKFTPPYSYRKDPKEIDVWNEDYAHGLRIDNPIHPSIDWYPN